jgi:methionyl-tRNA formyltransferase
MSRQRIPDKGQLRLVFFASSLMALPAVMHLWQRDLLVGVMLVPRADAEFHYYEQQLAAAGIPRIDFDPASIDTSVAMLRDLKPDLALVCGFNYLLPEALLTVPRLGSYNLHPSRLPAFRGANPLFWQLRQGVTDACLTAIKMDAGLDSGPILQQQEFAISQWDTFGSLLGRFSDVLPGFIDELVRKFEQDDGVVALSPQDTEGVNEGQGEAPVVTEAHLRVDWRHQTAIEIVNLARAANPNFGGTILSMNGVQLQLLQATKVEADNFHLKPGTILSICQRQGLLVTTLDGVVRLDILGNNAGWFDGYRFAIQHGLAVTMMFDSATLTMS